MTNGVDSPFIKVDRNSFATISAINHAVSVMENMIMGRWSAKKAPINSRNTGIFAPQGIKGAVRIVASFSRGLRNVRAAITPGTAHPPAIPPEIIKGITELPWSPKIRNILSIM